MPQLLWPGFQNAFFRVPIWRAVIKRAGGFEILKYKANASGILTEGQFPFHTDLNQFNTLQVTAHGNTFSFKINDQPVPLPGLGQSITDSDLTGGQLGVFVTGPNVVKTVTHEDVTSEELGGALTHASKSGVTHFTSANEMECINHIKKLLSYYL